MSKKILKNYDIIIENDGKFYTITFQSDRAKEIVKSDSDLSDIIDNNLIKISVSLLSISNLIGWAFTHKLTTIKY